MCAKILMTAMMLHRSLVVVSLYCLIGYSHSWSLPNQEILKNHAKECGPSRRDFFRSLVATTTAATTATAFSPRALAVPPPGPEELEKIRKGYARVEYLLNNWDYVTQICGKTVMSDKERKQVIQTEGGYMCEKTPLRVQEFMGYKSTQDPLYRVEKLLVRATPLVDPDDGEKYIDAVERYKEKADNTAMMAYTSSWGEANPNGGKEVIEAYLEKTKEDVIESAKLLREIMTYLDLEPLPPLTGKL